MKIKILKIISLILMGIGVFLIVIQPFQPVTGAVIDMSTIQSRTNFFVGLSFIVIGLVLAIVHIKNKK